MHWHWNKRRTAAGVVLLLGLFLIAAVSVVVKTADGGTPAAGAPASSCITGVHYFANDAPSGSNFFGPPATSTTTSTQVQGANDRMACDPALTAGIAHYMEIGDFSSLTGDQLTIRADQMTQDPNRVLWNQTIQQIDAAWASQPQSDGTMSGTYQTEYMIPQGSGAPLIRQATLTRATFPVLHIGPWTFKLNCGFQPVSQQPFPGITSMPPPGSGVCTSCGGQSGGCAGSNCSMSPGCTSGCGSGGCTSNCGSSGCTSNCNSTTTTTQPPPCNIQVCLGKTNQPPQSNGLVPPSDVEPTPGATTTPATSPSPPAGAGTGSNSGLPPTSGGNDTGSSTGSGTAGGTTCQPSTGCGSSSQTGGGGPTNQVGSGDGNGTQGGTGGGSSSTGGGNVPNPFS